MKAGVKREGRLQWVAIYHTGEGMDTCTHHLTRGAGSTGSQGVAQETALQSVRGVDLVNSFKPLPIDPEKRRQAMWLLRGEGWDFYNIARAFGTSLTEARLAVDGKHHTPQRTFLCDEEGSR